MNNCLTKKNNSLKNQEQYLIIDKNFQQNIKDNGRIQLQNGENGTPCFYMQDMIAKNEKTHYQNATQYMLTPTMLSHTFFSLENIENLQSKIRKAIYEKTNYKHIIDKQDYDQLKIIMRSIFLQYGKHRDDNILEQINVLNGMVLKYCIPKVYSELMAYLKYKKDISTLAVPLENPSLFTNDKTIELNNFF